MIPFSDRWISLASLGTDVTVGNDAGKHATFLRRIGTVGTIDRDPLALWVPIACPAVRFDPLTEAHREPLRARCGEDLAIWKMYVLSYDPDHFDESYTALLTNPARLPFAVLVDDEVVGMTAWIDTDARHLTAEIGNTYIAPRWRGGRVNGAMKTMMFAHGFACGLKRMYLSVDTRNERSQAACRKVGATLEGVLRNHKITWTGYLRDSAIFSVVERDRERLGL
jgi:RimJ/RimL family protein N-acetyltransferase